MKKSINFLVSFAFLLAVASACSVNKPFLADDSARLLARHQRVAILPFYVTMSEDYKRIQSRRYGQRNETYWKEQERLAGIDLQKNAFLKLTKKINKGKYAFTVQDFITTNKTLEKEGIRFSQLRSFEKGTLARILGVDAVIWGESDMELDYTSFQLPANNGITTTLKIYDGETREMVWSNQSFQAINNRMDSPQYLASRTTDTLLSTLPYKK
jgi:hypothetical protein